MQKLRVSGSIDIRSLAAKNIITSEGRDALLTAIAGNTSPGWAYLAVGTGSSTPGSAQTALDCELYRGPFVGGWVTNPGTARLVAVFTAGEANGTWYEFGIFNEPAKQSVLSACDGTAGWSSDGTLVSETSYVMQGAASLRCQMPAGGSVAFQGTALVPSTPDISSVVWSASDRLQFWYRSSTDIGTVWVRVGNSGSAYYLFQWVPGSANTWHLFSEKLSNAGTVVGYPLMPFQYFLLYHSPQASPFNEYVDYISIYGENGEMMTRGVFGTPVTKEWQEVLNAHYTVVIE